MKLSIHSHAREGTELQAELEKATNPKGLVILSHNASGDMNNKILLAVSQAFIKRGICSLRYNFHYVNGIGSEAAEWKDIVSDIEAVYAKAQEVSDGPIYVCGKSLGAMASLYLASQHREIHGLGLFAIPKSMLEKYLDLKMLNQINAPVYVFHGTEDRFGSPDEIETFLRTYLGENLNVTAMNQSGHSFDDQNSDEENQMLAEEIVSLILK